MAVTSTTNFLTTISQNGGSPTGVAGNIINRNFSLLDSQFSMDSISNWSAKQAINAEYACNAGYASNAGYAFSCANSGGSSDTPEFALRTGFQTTQSNYQHLSLWPYAIYGSLQEMYAITGSGSSSGAYCTTPVGCAALPPFGPFMVDALVCLYPYQSSSEVIYAKVLVSGWNLGIQKIHISEAWNSSGSSVTLTGSTTFDSSVAVQSNTLYFGISASSLRIFYGDTGRTWVGHVSARVLYPSTYDMGNSCS